MSARIADPLWPMLLGLGALLGGALVLQAYAERRGNDPIVVAIQAGAPLELAGEEGADEESAPPTPGPLSEEHAKAQLVARRGELAEALELYSRAVQEHSEAAALRDEYGVWLLRAKRPEEALRELTEARRLAPSDPAVALHLGQALSRVGKVAEAEEELRRAIALRPAFGAAMRALGVLLKKRKAWVEAAQVLEVAAASGSNEERASALVALGTVQLSAGRRAEAERSFDRAIQFAPAEVEVRIGIARAWLGGDAGDRTRAVALLTRAAELAPDLPQVHSALGRALERTGDRAGAEAAYANALALDPSYRFVRRRVLRLALEDRDFVRARVQAERLLAGAPDEPEHHFLAALVADREGRGDKARAHYREAIARAEGNYPEAYFNLGLMEKRQGHLSEAIAAYEEALRLRPEYLAAINNLALAKLAGGDVSGAEELLRGALARDPHYASALLNLGEVLMKQDRRAEAIVQFQRALAARPGYAEARLNLGVAYAREGKLEEARATYRTLVEESPRYAPGWFNLAVAAQAAGRSEEAVAALRRVLEIDPEHLGALRKLAELETSAGDLNKAASAWTELLDREPADRSARIALAEILWKVGDASGCARAARALLAKTPEDAEGRKLLDRCTELAAVPARGH